MDILQLYPNLGIIQQLARQEKRQVFLVGGFLRDLLLKRVNHDMDFAIDKNALSFAKKFANSIKGSYVVLDEERGCARVVKKSAEVAYTFDFSDFRAKTFAGDLKLRDFTINTFSLDVVKLKSGDFHKQLLANVRAKKDLKNKKITMVAPRAFLDDPLRVLRAFSLQAVTGFSFDAKTIVQIKKDKQRLSGMAYERINDELFKILKSSRTFTTFNAMDKMGVMEEVIPQVKVMFGCKQGGYHHLDVWKHTLEAIKQFEGVLKEYADNPDAQKYLNESIGGGHPRYAIIKLALLLHDIGKPDTKKLEGDRFSFHAHEHVGKGIARLVAKMLKLSSHERYAVEDMVLLHMRPGYLGDVPNPTARSVYRYFRDAKEETASVLLLSIADQRATKGPLTSAEDSKQHEAVCRRLIQQYFDECKKEPVVRLLTGNDLIKKLKLKPSPLFGEILSKVAEQQALKIIKTHDDALELAKNMVKTYRPKVKK